MSTFTHTIVTDPLGNPFKLPFFMTQAVIDGILREFTVRDDDVFITTYPRSGTTWMQQIVHLLTCRGIQGDEHLEVVIPYLERAAAFNGLAPFEQIKTRRFFKTHLPFTFQLYRRNPAAKFIYVARNPKDCAVSLYYFMGNNYRIAYQGTWEDFVTLFISGGLIYGKWSEHVSQWWRQSRTSTNILFLKYEDLHRDPAGIAAKVACFLGVDMGPELLTAILPMTTFDQMAQSPKTNLSWAAWRADADSRPLRKGRVGDWQNHFTAEQNQRMEVMCRQLSAEFGLEFDFE